LALAGDGDRLNFVHVVDTSTVLIPLADGALISATPMRDNLLKNARAVCAGAVERARECGLDATSTVIDGPPAEAILRFTADTGAGMIVVGTHARSGLSRLLLGSVAEAILRRSPVPVMVTHADDVPRDGPILVAVDDSKPARAAFRFALGSALRSGRTLHLLYVRTASESYAMPAFVSDYCREARTAGVGLETSICSGEIAEAIISAADSRACSTVVLGTHGRNALQRIMHHEIVHTVVESAKVPVAVVHAQHDRSKVAETAAHLRGSRSEIRARS